MVDPARWGPDDPNLYSCRVTLGVGDEVVDDDRTTFGIRTLALDARHGLRVNGEPVLLRGACVHHDNGPIGAATIGRAEERRVELLKAAGFNAIRSAHNPLSPAMLDACDRLGMLVMDETFDIWAQTKTADDYALRFEDCWEADVEAMVRKDVNHPSVVLYSIGNEIPDGSTATGLQRSRALAEKVRALDPTRYVTQAVTGMLVAGSAIIQEIGAIAAAHNVDEETGVNTAALNLGELMDQAMTAPVVGEKTEEAFAHLDVAGYNYMYTRFEVDGAAYPNRVIVATETHPTTVDRGWAGVTDHPQVIGDFTWTGWDYLGEAGIGRTAYGEAVGGLGMSAFHGDFPWAVAGCGDLDITGHRRPQSYYREIVFGLRTDPYVAVLRPEHHGQARRPTPAPGRGPTWWRAGAGKATKASRSPSRSTPAPTRSSCWSTAGRSDGSRRGRTTASRPCSRPTTSPATSSPWPGRATRRSGATCCGPPPGPCAWPCRSIAPRSVPVRTSSPSSR